MPDEKEKIVWLALAELFFLDTEPQECDFVYTAALLKDAGWDRETTQNFLICFVAPAAGANLGYLIYPVIGAWAGFNKEAICSLIQNSIDQRRGRPAWFFFLSDRFNGRMLKKLDMQRLLNKI